MLRHSSHIRLSLRTLFPTSSARFPLLSVARYPSRPGSPFPSPIRLSFSRPAVDEKSSPSDAQTEPGATGIESLEKDGNGNWRGRDDFPSGELEFRPHGPWMSFLVKLRMLFAWPWERVRKGSVLSMKLRGSVWM